MKRGDDGSAGRSAGHNRVKGGSGLVAWQVGSADCTPEAENVTGLACGHLTLATKLRQRVGPAGIPGWRDSRGSESSHKSTAVTHLLVFI